MVLKIFLIYLYKYIIRVYQKCIENLEFEAKPPYFFNKNFYSNNIKIKKKKKTKKKRSVIFMPSKSIFFM